MKSEAKSVEREEWRVKRGFRFRFRFRLLKKPPTNDSYNGVGGENGKTKWFSVRLDLFLQNLFSPLIEQIMAPRGV